MSYFNITKALFILLIFMSSLSCAPTPIPAIPNGTRVIVTCKSYCMGDTPVRLRGATGRSAITHNLPDDSEAVILESTVDGELLYYKVQVDSAEGWIEVASYGVEPIINKDDETQTQVNISWSHKLTGLSGSRWDIWEKVVQSQETGLSWTEFKDEVVKYNPQLVEDEYVFMPDKEYVLPELK